MLKKLIIRKSQIIDKIELPLKELNLNDACPDLKWKRYTSKCRRSGGCATININGIPIGCDKSDLIA